MKCKKANAKYQQQTDPYDLPGINPNGFNIFMREVGKEKGKSSKWVRKVQGKLYEIGLHHVKDVVENIFRINQMLRAKGLTEFYDSTLQALVTVGANLCIEQMTYEKTFIASDGTMGMKNKGVELFYCDSGASTHMGCSDLGMTEIKSDRSIIKMGGGSQTKSMAIGRKHLLMKQKDGQDIQVSLYPFKYVPDLKTNLFSLTQAMKNGWTIGNDGLHITVTKGDAKIIFDVLMKTQSGYLCAVETYTCSTG